LQRPLESAQYTSDNYTQTLDDHDVTRSLGSTGDCYDNALAESFVDSFKTELIADRVWRNHDQAELAIVEWVGWFNHRRLHSSLGDIPPVEYEQRHAAAAHAPNVSISLDRSVAATSPRAANGLTTRRGSTTGVDFVANGQISPVNAPVLQSGVGSGRHNGSQGTNGRGWPLRPVVDETYSLTQTSTSTTSTTEEPT
jgi:putative transposase